MGVRISWLTTARNSLRARAARSADNLGWRALRCGAMDSLTGHKGRIRPVYSVNLQPGKHLPEDVKSRPAPRAPYQLAGLCLVLVAVIGVATYRYDLYEKEAIGREVRNQLLAIADMKVRQISDWRAERIGEAQVLMADGMSLGAMRRVLAGEGGASERAQVLTWMQALCNRLPYADAVLSDPRGRRVLSAGRKIGSDEHLRQLAEETVRQEDAAWRDFHRDGPGGAVHLGLNIPLRLAPGSPAFGALMLGIDPADYLYPLLQKWPTPSASGETLLVRRDGGDALYLNDLRYRPNAALNLRVPLSRAGVPAIQAVNGHKGSVEGPDYRGVPVFAAVRAIPGTPWFLVAKVDAGEVQSPIARRSALTGIAALSLMLAVAAWVGFLWRRQQARFYRDRYQAELERRALAGHYDYLSRFANDIILLMDEDGRIVEANDRALDAYGYSREDLLRKNIRELRDPSEREALEEQWNETAERGSLLFEAVHRRRDGSGMPVEVSSRTIVVEGRAFRQSIIRDITERRRAQAALLQSEQRFRQVVEHAPEGIAVVDSDMRFQYLNPVAVRLLGAQSASELLGRSHLDLVHPDERAASLERSSQVAQGVPKAAAERRFVRLDGETLPVEISGAPFEYDGRPAAIAFFHDITERKRTEAERSQLEAQLRQAQKMESVGRLAGGVAHDFNNHLTVIGGYCDMLLADLPAGDAAREAIGEIRAAGARAAALTQQLLAFSRKQIAEAKPISLNGAVADASRMLRRLIGEDVEIVTALDPEPVTIMADRGQINQVVMNLAINARDAMPQGGRLTIETGAAEIDASYASLHLEARPGHYATLTVTDTGVGMNPETMQRIFEPFFTTKGMGVGTGLGLATVYGIVRQSGGWIRVYSEPGRGAMFQVYFPRVDGPAEASVAPARHAEDGRGSETVLVVEDQPEVRRLALTILSQKGYRLLEASNGAEALALSANYAEPIDLLLTDVVMPGMTGRELANRLLETRPTVKVLFTSGYTAEVISHQDVLDAGAAYLPKPFTASQLTLKIREILGTA